MDIGRSLPGPDLMALSRGTAWLLCPGAQGKQQRGGPSSCTACDPGRHRPEGCAQSPASRSPCRKPHGGGMAVARLMGPEQQGLGLSGLTAAQAGWSVTPFAMGNQGHSLAPAEILGWPSGPGLSQSTGRLISTPACPRTATWQQAGDTEAAWPARPDLAGPCPCRPYLAGSLRATWRGWEQGWPRAVAPGCRGR